MLKETKFIILAISFLISTSAAFAFDLGTKNSFDNPPPANLVYPAGEQADLSGNDSLEFQWSDDYPTETEGYEFKLYKGYSMTDANLISKENLSPSVNSLNLNRDKFEDGRAYTWSIKRVANCGRKSDPAYNSFRVKK